MTNGFKGIYEKLKRADENIQNLKVEVSGFFKKCKYPKIPKLDDEKLAEALNYHHALKIPPRFSVLAGEIVHHLRSCLDHIVWELSDDAYRNSPNFRFIEFPLLEKRPSLKDKFTRYERKIKGVQNPRARELIEEHQPYQRVSPRTDLLWIIHNMDVADKHRELVIVSSFPSMNGLTQNLFMEIMRRKHGAGGPLTPELKRQFDQHAKITPQVSFRDFGGGVVQPIVPRLTQLTGHVRSVVARFERLH